jgi:DnaJ domain
VLAANPTGPAVISSDTPRRPQRFHGRVDRDERCAHPGCSSPGEFRAPQSNRLPGNEGGWQFLCLDHVRAFNAGYNFFDGLSPDEIAAAASPLAGWERAATGRGGREAFHFTDAHDLFGGERRPAASASWSAPSVRRWAGEGDARALGVLGLGDDAGREDVRRAYKRLVRAYHPDSNGGDRAGEGKLQAVVNAYTHLKSSRAFRSES